jgi:predicted Zn finger-like uncharacterized protein
MNYITSCPACETQFLLNKEHLKAHRGKVQCGNCEHIFNAKNRLTEISDDIHSPAEYQASLEAQAESSDISSEKPIGDVLNIVLESVPNLEDLNSSESNQEADSSYIGDKLPKTDEAINTDLIQAPIIIEDLTTDPKFQNIKTKTNYWLIIPCLVLALLAGLQVIYFQRTKISAEYPQFKPYLVQACAVLNCKIDLPSNLEFLTIDDSDMQEDENHQNVIKFSSLLINNAPYTQAYPNIELTLTDTSDKAVLRKIIKPIDYLDTNIDRTSGIGSREEVRIKLAINVTDLAVAGYRVLLDY